MVRVGVVENIDSFFRGRSGTTTVIGPILRNFVLVFIGPESYTDSLLSQLTSISLLASSTERRDWFNNEFED